MRAFNKGELLILRLEIDDDRWQRAMKAIRDSTRVTGTMSRPVYERTSAEAPWKLSLDIAAP